MFKLIVLFAVIVCALTEEITLRKPQLDGRIVGGHSVDISAYGWQVSLQRSSHFCGGSIISDTWIVTAAHCFSTTNPSGLNVRAGSTVNGSGGSVHAVAQVILHPRYNTLTQDIDVALLRLSTPLRLNGNEVRTIPLTSAGDNSQTGSIVTVTGWGRLSEGGARPTSLQAVRVPVVAQDECNRQYANRGGVTENMLCAGYPEGGMDACQGDSGGPLVDTNRKLVGVVSWGIGCARPNKSGVYTRLASPVVRDFIRQHTGL